MLLLVTCPVIDSLAVFALNDMVETFLSFLFVTLDALVYCVLRSQFKAYDRSGNMSLVT